MFAFYNGPRRNLRADDVAGIQAIYGARYFTIPGFRPWANYGIGVGRWLVGDFNGDGRDDLIHLVDGTDYTHPWISRGDGTFDVRSFRPWANYGIPNGRWLVGDFNGDGMLDVWHGVANTDYIHIWRSVRT